MSSGAERLGEYRNLSKAGDRPGTAQRSEDDSLVDPVQRRRGPGRVQELTALARDLETLRLIEEGSVLEAFLNAAVSLLVGFVACAGGVGAGRGTGLSERRRRVARLTPGAAPRPTPS